MQFAEWPQHSFEVIKMSEGALGRDVKDRRCVQHVAREAYRPLLVDCDIANSAGLVIPGLGTKQRREGCLLTFHWRRDL